MTTGLSAHHPGGAAAAPRVAADPGRPAGKHVAASPIRRTPVPSHTAHAGPGGRTAPSSGRSTPSPTFGARATGTASPAVRSCNTSAASSRIASRDVSPVKRKPRIPSYEIPYPGLKVGITLMTRKPHCFDWWLRYHRSLGIHHVFVHVEDTPELLPLLNSDEFAGFVTVTTGSDGSLDTHKVDSADNYYTLMARQERQVRRSMALCRERGYDWLFHVDDDELLHFSVPFSTLADTLPMGVSCMVLVNIEACPKNLGSECVFEDIKTFSQHKMLAYRNGKSAGRVIDSNWHGPHRFTGSYHVVPVERACVLHFESCTYEGWRNKFLKHREIGEQKKLDIPFPFYRDSISLFQNDHDGGPNEIRWKNFFMDRKARMRRRAQTCASTPPRPRPRPPAPAPALSLTRRPPALAQVGNFADLRESEKTRLTLSCNMRQMVNSGHR